MSRSSDLPKHGQLVFESHFLVVGNGSGLPGLRGDHGHAGGHDTVSGYAAWHRGQRMARGGSLWSSVATNGPQFRTVSTGPSTLLTSAAAKKACECGDESGLRQ